jgi:hypothetical protein
MVQHVFDSERLLVLLDADLTRVQSEYVALLFAGKYDEATEKMSTMDLIQAHIAYVEAL